MKFQHVTFKIGNMKKEQEFTICPMSAEFPNLVTLQSDKRIARVNLETGKITLSDGKGGHPGLWKLHPYTGAKQYDCPAELLEQLKEKSIPIGPFRILG